MKQLPTIRIGIASRDEIQARTIAIARGDYKPQKDEPKVWFTSIKSLAEVLSEDNRALLRVIREQHPESIGELAELTGRAPSNVSRTLKTMSHYGFVTTERVSRNVRPIAKVQDFEIRAT